jgi:Flp pilus assembly protein TadB
MMLYGGFGALFGLVMVAQFGLPLLIAAGAVALGAVVGYMEPDGKLAKAARKRQELITLEMGFKVPELSTYAMSSGVETSLRQLGNRPGGPFVAETRRVVRIYDARGSLAPGLDQMRDRNPGEQIQEFATQLRMAAEQGGNLLAALDVLSASSRRAMSRYIRERTLRNLRAVRGQIVVWMGVLVLLLMLAPIAITVAGSLGSM